MTLFTDANAAIEEAQYLTAATRQPHAIVESEGEMVVAMVDDALTGRVFEVFNPLGYQQEGGKGYEQR